jgi:hypothetical protein
MTVAGAAMGEIESVGEIVTGGMIAGTVEPPAGGNRQPGGVACLNCGAVLGGFYCSACGQSARVQRSLSTFFGDLIQGLFNFEGKIWRTLPMLAWRPGEMTRRYIEGQRARFVSPVALYLFTVFLMFAVLSSTGTLGSGEQTVKIGLANAAAEERSAIATLRIKRSAAIERGADVASIDRQIARRVNDVAELDRMRTGEGLQTRKLEGEGIPPWLRKGAEKIQRDPAAFIGKVQDAASKFSWLLIPLSVPFMWLLFPLDRRYRLYDHTVFVTYSLSFMMMLVIAGGLMVSLGIAGIASWLFFVPPVHMYRQLRGAYSLSRVSALLRTVVLTIFSFTVTILFFMAMLGIGLFD